MKQTTTREQNQNLLWGLMHFWPPVVVGIIDKKQDLTPEEN